MKNYIYVLKNNFSKRFESVMSFPSDGMALHRLSQGGIDKKEFELNRCGSVDIETGIVEPCPPTPLIWEQEEALPKTEAE